MILEGNSFWGVLWWLLAAHALTDYAWQSDFIATYKHPHYDGEKRAQVGPWWWTMGAHALINGAGVAWVCRHWQLGLVETIVHFITDTLKCLGIIGTKTDQAIHLLSKVAYAYWWGHVLWR